jgi:hypothetical protein
MPWPETKTIEQAEVHGPLPITIEAQEIILLMEHRLPHAVVGVTTEVAHLHREATGTLVEPQEATNQEVLLPAEITVAPLVGQAPGVTAAAVPPAADLVEVTEVHAAAQEVLA